RQRRSPEPSSRPGRSRSLANDEFAAAAALQYIILSSCSFHLLQFDSRQDGKSLLSDQLHSQMIAHQHVFKLANFDLAVIERDRLAQCLTLHRHIKNTFSFTCAAAGSGKEEPHAVTLRFLFCRAI